MSILSVCALRVIRYSLSALLYFQWRLHHRNSTTANCQLIGSLAAAKRLSHVNVVVSNHLNCQQKAITNSTDCQQVTLYNFSIFTNVYSKWKLYKHRLVVFVCIGTRTLENRKWYKTTRWYVSSIIYLPRCLELLYGTTFSFFIDK